MCGRYFRRSDKQELATRASAGVIDPEIPKLLQHYNIAPTTFQPVVRHTRDGGARELLLMRWGLIPHFATDPKKFGFSTFNAKCEDIAAKPTWRSPLTRGQRCLIPADGFYEWKTLAASATEIQPDVTAKKPVKSAKPDKQLFAFTVYAPGYDEPQTFAFAGLWDRWHDRAQDQWLESFTIITTGPNDVTRDVHNRMPVILHESDWDEWMLREGPAPTHLLQPYPDSEMSKRSVSKDVGNVRNNHPELLNSK